MVPKTAALKMRVMARAKSNVPPRRIIKIATGGLVLVAIYYFLNLKFGFTISCWFERLTGWYCPGCGVTRMLFAIIEGNFYQAFRFNPLVFILLIFAAILLVNYLICYKKGEIQAALYKQTPHWFWIVLLIIVLAYGILRNLPCCDFLAPTIV